MCRASLFTVTLLLPVWAGQSLTVQGSFEARANVPSSKPYTALSNWCIQGRMHNWNAPASGERSLITNFTFEFKFLGPNLLFTSADAVEGGGAHFYRNIAGYEDFYFRGCRDISNMVMRFELWKHDASLPPIVVQRRITSRQDRSAAGDFVIGAENGGISSGSFAFLCWTTNVGAPATTPIDVANPKVCDLGFWTFENSMQDISGRKLNLSPTSKPVFVKTPGYAPVISTNAPFSVRAGFDATISDGGSFSFSEKNQTLRHRWEAIDGPAPVRFEGSNTADSVKATFPVAGSYVVRHEVTDADGLTSQSDLEIGAVATDNNGVVILDGPQNFILGPLIHLGRNPWPWADERNMFIANTLGAELMNPNAASFQDDWNTELGGKVSVKKNSDTVIGEGTRFLTDFCPGGKPNQHPIVIWYARDENETGRVAYEVKSCESDTELTLSEKYARQTQEGASYAKMANLASWINGSENRNYYDNVMGYYALYYRTGLGRFLNYARTLADRWVSQPYVDFGHCAEIRRCLGDPRRFGFAGIALRALDGRPELWNILYAPFAEENTKHAVRRYKVGDSREGGYTLIALALTAKFHPDEEVRADARSMLNDMKTNGWMPVWEGHQDASWAVLGYGFSSWNAQPGKAAVVKGSKVVKGHGTKWGDKHAGSALWILNDPHAYLIERSSDTEVLLATPYEGETKSNVDWQFGDIVGTATAPWALGITTTGFYWTGLVTGDEQWLNWATATIQYIREKGFNPQTNGVYYYREGANCEPIVPATALNAGCSWSNNPKGARFLAAELMSAFSRMYLATNDPALLELGDRLYGAIYGKLGGPSAVMDGNYPGELEDSSILTYKKSKDFGFTFGFGGAAMWPAARLGGVQPLNVKKVKVPFRLTGDATQARAIVIRPSGEKTQSSCAESPCEVELDVRQGPHQVGFEFTDDTGKILSTTEFVQIYP